MHLVCSIFLSAATNHYTVLVTHIVGTNNSIADSLSRLQTSRFRRLAPTADQCQFLCQQQPFGTPASLPPVSGYR